MNKKGFTLIELLAVIVILAIIALITIPIINKIVTDSKENAFIDSAYAILDSAENFAVKELINETKNRNYTFTFNDKKQYSDYKNKKLLFKGMIPDNGNIIISNDNKIKLALWSDSLKKCVYKGYNDSKIVFDENLNSKEKCELQNENIRATWLWMNYNIDYEIQYVKNKSLRESMLDKLYDIGINTIYIPMEENQIENTYKDFIIYANSKGIKVYDLIGDPTSILETQRKITINDKMDEIANFNEKMKNSDINSKIEGIHYDVEFYGQSSSDFGLGKWINGQSEEAKKGKRRLAYINFSKVAKEYASKKNLKVEYDITQELGKFTYYDENNKEKNMLEELLKNSDGVTIMYYVTMKKYITTNNQLTLIGNFTFPHEDDSPDSNTNVKISTIEYINKYLKQYSIGTELSSFRKDYVKKTTCKTSFVNELVPTYIDSELEYTKDYLNNFYKQQQQFLIDYESDNDMDSEIGIAYHDAWELLYLNGYDTQVMTNRISNFNNELESNSNCR